MADYVIHISEGEAASDFAGLLARVRAGAEVVIESGKMPVAVIRAPIPPRRSISECIGMLPEDSTATIDADFARDVRQPSKVLASRSNRLHGTNPRFKRADHC
jgi:antitoxin (DNA-binding transcriptional repressor) of toxin-antitoxin stability system